MIQFFWQFPHFWAIGWFLFDDYEKAGFFMLPTGKQDKGTAVQIIMYTVWTILASLVPALGFTGDLTLSIIGCVVNGPGEAAMTDIGITGGGKGNNMLYLSGIQSEKVLSEDIISRVVSEVEKKAAELDKKL